MFFNHYNNPVHYLSNVITFLLLAALKKWKDISHELHETSVTLKNEFQETSLAATLNFGATNPADEKTSLIPEQEKDEIIEIKEVDNQPEMDYNEYTSYQADCSTSAY